MRLSKVLSLLSAVLCLSAILTVAAFAAVHEISDEEDIVSIMNSSDLENGDTIKLKNDILYWHKLLSIKKDLIIDLNGFALECTNNGAVTISIEGSSLTVKGPGKLLINGGDFKDSSSLFVNGGALNVTGDANVGATDGRWTVYAVNASKVNLHAVYGAENGIYAADKSEVTVGFIQMTTGDAVLTAKNAVTAVTGAKVTVDEWISVSDTAEYIMTGSQVKKPNDYAQESSKDMYYEYTDGESYVWVRKTGDSSTTYPPYFVIDFIAVPIESGVRLSWIKQSGDQFYRVFRSTSPGAEGISVTDFAITATDYIDVNVKPNTTYYYTVRQVLADADPWNDTPEQLGPPIGLEQRVTTGSTILDPDPTGGGANPEKHFILMKLDETMMNVDGIPEEIDPGRGTTPVNRSGRVILPISSLIKKIGGEVAWDAKDRKITLKVGAREVVMWVDKTDLIIDGKESEMDVAPVIINDRTMVPVRFAAESSGCKVEWLNASQEIVVVFYLP